MQGGKVQHLMFEGRSAERTSWSAGVCRGTDSREPARSETHRLHGETPPEPGQQKAAPGQNRPVLGLAARPHREGSGRPLFKFAGQAGEEPRLPRTPRGKPSPGRRGRDRAALGMLRRDEPRSPPRPGAPAPPRQLHPGPRRPSPRPRRPHPPGLGGSAPAAPGAVRRCRRCPAPLPPPRRTRPPRLPLQGGAGRARHRQRHRDPRMGPRGSAALPGTHTESPESIPGCGTDGTYLVVLACREGPASDSGAL